MTKSRRITPVRGTLLILLAAGGCATKVDMPVEQGTACTNSIVLDGSMSAAPTSIDVDLGSTDVCLQLDASRNVRQAHLMITVDAPNDPSARRLGLASTLVGEDNAT